MSKEQEELSEYYYYCGDGYKWEYIDHDETFVWLECLKQDDQLQVPYFMLELFFDRKLKEKINE